MKTLKQEMDECGDAVIHLAMEIAISLRLKEVVVWLTKVLKNGIEY